MLQIRIEFSKGSRYLLQLSRRMLPKHNVYRNTPGFELVNCRNVVRITRYKCYLIAGLKYDEGIFNHRRDNVGIDLLFVIGDIAIISSDIKAIASSSPPH